MKAHLEVVKRFIVSGRDLDLMADYGDAPYTALQAANAADPDDDKREDVADLALLLERYLANPTQTMSEVCVNLGLYRPAAFVFAQVVFLCDGLLRLKNEDLGTFDPARRFLSIASRLPMELQVVPCHWYCGADLSSIPSWERENAFQLLTRQLLFRRKVRINCQGNYY